MATAVLAHGELVNTSLMVPPPDAEPWPSLGGQVCDFIEANLVHGPGDVLGMPAMITDELRLWIWRAYEVYPRGHDEAGRRRFKRGELSRVKGWAKTEAGAWIGITELDPAGPVRFDGWDSSGAPVGRPVRDPYIPMVATTEIQSDELAFGAAYAILENCALGNHYDIGLTRITPRNGPGKMVSLAAAPNSRDGARTTFQLFDETHLFLSDRLREAHRTMLRNIPKRRAADPWSMYTTTMYEPGAGSVAEEIHALAIDIAAGRVEDSRLYFDHRQAGLHHDLSRKRELIRAIEEAFGDAVAWADIPSIAGLYLEPGSDRPGFRRYFLNQRVKGSGRWLAPELYERLGVSRRRPAKGTECILAFDGSSSRDSTGIMGCTLTDPPHLWVEEVWEKPRSEKGQWRVSRLDVDAAVDRGMQHYQVVEFAPDPPGWYHEIEEWEERYGDIVVRFETNQPSRMGPAADQFEQAVKDGVFTHDGSEPLLRHLGNCIRKVRRGYSVPVKASDDSPDKIDLAIGAVIAYTRAMWHITHPPVHREILVRRGR